MSNRCTPGVFMLVSVIGLSLAACNKPVPPAASPASTPAASDAHDHDGHSHGANGHEHSGADREKVKVELAKLSPEDAAAAEKQHVCPVSGEMLGTMGPPKKVDVNGQAVWICCDGCRDALTSDSEKYLAKLKKG